MLFYVIVMAKNTNNILFQLGRELAFGKRRVQIPVALNETNGGEIFQICASSIMAIYAIGMTKLEANW